MHTTIIKVIGFALIFICVATPLTLVGQETSGTAIFTDFNVVLSVSDVRKSVAFYETILEFKLEHWVIGSAKEVAKLSPLDPEPYAANMLVGNQHISLEKSVDSPKPDAARYTFHVTDVAAYYDRLVKRGVSVHLIARDTAGKPWWFSVADPDGHWYMFMGPTARR